MLEDMRTPTYLNVVTFSSCEPFRWRGVANGRTRSPFFEINIYYLHLEVLNVIRLAVAQLQMELISSCSMLYSSLVQIGWYSRISSAYSTRLLSMVMFVLTI